VKEGVINSVQTFILHFLERRKFKRVAKLCFDIITTANYNQLVFSTVLNKIGLSKTLIILIIMLL